MGRTRHKEMQIEHRRTRVAELHAKNWKQAEIARELGVSQSTISSDLRAIRQESNGSQIEDLEEAVASEIKRTDLLSQEAWEGWERSQQPAETSRIVQKKGEKRMEKTVRQRTGDPRFLRIGHRAIETRSRLLGLDSTATEEERDKAFQQAVWQRVWSFYFFIQTKTLACPLSDTDIAKVVKILGKVEQQWDGSVR